MKWRATIRFLLLLGALSGGAVRSSHAVQTACATLSIEVDTDISVRHPELAGRVQGAFEGRPHVEPCPRIRLSLERKLINVEVVLPDGRSARRWLERSEDVVPTLEALLLVPDFARPVSKASPPSKPSERPRPPSSSTLRQIRRSRASSTKVSSVRIDLSGAVGARAGDGHFGLGLGLGSFLEVWLWLIGLQARADRYTSSNDSVDVLELMLPIGRRFYLEPLALDLVAGPALAWQRGTRGDVAQSSDIGNTSVAPVSREVTTSEHGAEPRAFAGARLSFGARSVFRGFVGLDGDFALSKGSDASTGIPAPPAWTLGLSVGSTVGTP